MNNDKKLAAVSDAAMRAYGKIPNIIKCVEELAELQQALCKYMIGPVDADLIANVHEELADVSIMLHRMLQIFDPWEIEDWKTSKLEAMAQKLGLEPMEGGMWNEKVISP